ncbi:MAG: hypothetical protein OQJ89_07305 [Kangiellaceae bacterium]|nr:hypothetical protein [Kangiellaceae bacterium]
MFKKILFASCVSFAGLTGSAIALDIAQGEVNAEPLSTSADGQLVFSGYLNLVCDSPTTCGTYSSGWHYAKVYKKVKLDIPPSTEMRLYWKENRPAGIPAGRYTAKTIGAECPDGTNMTADWSLTFGGAPHKATSVDCDGVLHRFKVLQLP